MRVVIPAAPNARVMHQSCPSKSRGRRECRVLDAPAASHADEESMRVSHHRYAERSGIPRAMVLRLIAGSPRRPGFDCLRRLKAIAFRLDPSVGGPGPHAFAVREECVRRRAMRAEHPHVHRIPLPTSVTIAIRPSCGGGMREDNHMFLENGRRIFFRKGLDMVSD